jgi:anti-sigma factor RsiW
MKEAELEALEAQFSDYLDGAMAANEKAAFEQKLAASEEAREAFDEFKQTIEAVSGLHKMSAPQDFETGVEQTIHRRSAGRFFGRKAFGDRVPFEVIAVVALAVLLAVYVIMRRSGTGSLEMREKPDQVQEVSPEAQEAMPRP